MPVDIMLMEALGMFSYTSIKYVNMWQFCTHQEVYMKFFFDKIRSHSH